MAVSSLGVESSIGAATVRHQVTRHKRLHTRKHNIMCARIVKRMADAARQILEGTQI